jgi:hypothetical protein
MTRRLPLPTFSGDDDHYPLAFAEGCGDRHRVATRIAVAGQAGAKMRGAEERADILAGLWLEPLIETMLPQLRRHRGRRPDDRLGQQLPGAVAEPG